MTPHRLTAYHTQSYNRDGDEAVREILLFISRENHNKFSETGDMTLPTFCVRSVKNGEGKYIGIVRLNTGEKILETTYTDNSQGQMLYEMLNRVLPGWTYEEHYCDKVPATNPFDGKF
jgi:hypothetical protein